MVVRVTLLLTAALSLLLIPAAMLMIHILLPAFEQSIPPFLVLLPGVVSLSAAKVVGGYMSGVGRPGINSGAGMAGFAVNVVANLILIPRLGIVGAAAASLVSYTFTAVLLTGIAARSTHTPFADFWIPRPGDIRYVLAVSVGLLRRLRGMPRPMRGHPGA
jgi:O-antigen/teichoic acid export membrane protein